MTPRALTWSLQVLTLITLQTPPAAPSTSGPAGHWEGTIRVPGQELGIQVDLAARANTWEGQITIPAQHIKALPLTGVTVDANAVTFGMKSVPGDPIFKGTVAKDSKTISGELSQSGVVIPFTLTWKGEARLDSAPKNSPITKALEGSWEGSLTAGGTVLRLVLKLSNSDTGATGTLTSLDQGAAEIPVTRITQTESHVTIGVGAIGGTFDGAMQDGHLTGTWSQGPVTLPLVFTRSQK